MKNNDQQKTVVIGLSGGVDSSVAALLLKRKGYRVIGAFMKNFSDTKNPYTGECSYLEDKRMAQRVAALLGIRFVVFDFEKVYKKEVIEPMFKAYAKGLTPNPDILCNTIVKFPLFWKEAHKLGANYIAMGHYARIIKKKGYELFSGKDKTKDQSYFLSDLSQSDLEHTLFPLGNLSKKEVRKIAKKNNLPNWNKHGTVGICFVGKVHMQSFLKNRIKAREGIVKDPEGNIIGKHNGIQFYTIGQKVGEHIGIEIKKPKEYSQKRFYVADKIKPNVLIVAPENHPTLKKKKVEIKKIHIINPKEKIPNNGLKARIRHLGQLHSGKLIKNQFIFEREVESIAPGQYIVIYNKDKVIASGEIK